MEKTELDGYCEFASRLVDHAIDVRPVELLKAVDNTAVHTFGWPIAPVLHTEELRPRPNDEGITATIDSNGHFDFWTLKRNGDFYILKSLFEDLRRRQVIFLDTRTVRTAETFFRTGQLYMALGVGENTEIECKIEYGGLLNRTLTVASPNRDLSERVCTGDVLARTFRGPLTSFVEVADLKEKVFEVVSGITEMCDFFVPATSVVDQIVEDYIVNGKVT